jgi:protoporphyrinogen oxidase
MVPYDGYTCLGLEYFCSIGDGIWEMENTALAELAKREAAQIGLISESNVIDGCVIRMERAYPVYDKEYQSNVSIIRQELAILKNFQVIGRNGMHKYNNQDHSMMTGILAAKNVLGENFDVWRVNTDAEYLEAGEIYETGRITPQRIGNCVK